MVVKRSLSTTSIVILTPNEHRVYLHHPQVAKSTSISYVAHTCNTFACLTHSSSLSPWILDSRASDHLSGNNNLFSSLTTTSPLPMITLANGSQTMAKGINSIRCLPSLPLTFVLYVSNSPFNLVSISKLTRDLNCLITFSNNSITFQD